ncbi:MAG: FHA domain-containing protein, partial [Candidatus Binatia bacterium]
ATAAATAAVEPAAASNPDLSPPPEHTRIIPRASLRPASRSDAAPAAEARPDSEPPPSGETEAARRVSPVAPAPAPIGPLEIAFDCPGEPVQLRMRPHVRRIWFVQRPGERPGHFSTTDAVENVEINLSDQFTDISLQQAVITRADNGALYLGDSGSAYGTYVNGVKLQAGQPSPLQRTQNVRFGRSLDFTLTIDGDFPQHREGTHFPRFCIPVPELQINPRAPSPAERFPFGIFMADHPAPRSPVEVAYLEGPKGERESFLSDQNNWRREMSDGSSWTLYYDELGDWVVLGEGGSWLKVNGRPLKDWTLFDTSDVMNWGEGDWKFRRVDDFSARAQEPDIPIPLVRRSEHSIVTQIMDRATLERSLESRADLSTTQTMRVMEMPVLADLTPEVLAEAPAGKGPVQFRF